MSYWLYQGNRPLCQIEQLVDHRWRTGAVEVTVPAAMIDDLACLRGAIEVYNDETDEAETVHCLRAHRVGFRLVLTVVALGAYREPDAERFNEDWLIVDERPFCPLDACILSPVACPRGAHCIFRIASRHWCRLNYRRTRLPQLRQIDRQGLEDINERGIDLLSPLVYDGPRMEGGGQPRLEVLRLRQRLWLSASPDLADGDRSTPTIFAHVQSVERLEGPPLSHKPNVEVRRERGRQSPRVYRSDRAQSSSME